MLATGVPWTAAPNAAHRSVRPEGELLQQDGVSQRRAVPEADQARPEREQRLDGTAVLSRVRREVVGRLPQARLAGHEVNVGQDVTRDGDPVRVAEEDDVAGRVARRVD